MKVVFTCILLVCTFTSFAASAVKGVVQSPQGCEGPVMVWLSLDKENFKDRLLLMHTEVPVGGSFQFNLKNGDYQLRATDKSGCEFLERISIKDKIHTAKVMLVKK